ncbi:TolC family protein [Bacteroidota bacterium]
MKTLKYIIALVIITFSGNISAQDSLIQYLNTAAINNPGLKAKFHEYHAALEKVPQVGALPDPTIAFGYFIQPVETKVGPQQFKISISQMFPWFGTLNVLENSAEAIAKAKYQLFEEAKSKLFYDVKSTYYNLYWVQKAIDITNDNITILESFKNLANIKIESGKVSSVDAYRIEMEINDLKNQLALLKDNLWMLKVKFNNFLNIETNSPILITDKLLSSDISLNKESLVDSIMKNNNMLTGFDYQIEALQHKENAASKAGMPKFSIGLDYTLIGESNMTVANSGQDAFMFPKVGIVVPLYRKKYKAMVNEVVYLQQAKTEEKLDKGNMLETLFEKVWKDYQDASRRINLYQQQTILAQRSMSIIESQYATNNKDFEEILRMERKLLKYSLELEKAIADKEAAIAFINYLKGQ